MQNPVTGKFETCCFVRYDDGDEEDLTLDEARSVLEKEEGEEEGEDREGGGREEEDIRNGCTVGNQSGAGVQTERKRGPGRPRGSASAKAAAAAAASKGKQKTKEKEVGGAGRGERAGRMAKRVNPIPYTL